MTACFDQRARGRENGFTMIEVLAVLLLTGVLVSAMTVVTGQWLRSWNRGAANLQRVEMLSVAIDRLETDIQSAMALPPLLGHPGATFIGTKSTMLFVHPPIDKSAPRGLEIVNLFAASDGVLMRSRAPFDLDQGVENAEPRDPTAVLRKPYAASFAFLDDQGEWQDEWRRNIPPVSVRIVLSGGDVANLPRLSTVVPIIAQFPSICASAKTFAACKANAESQQANPANGAQQNGGAAVSDQAAGVGDSQATARRRRELQ